MQTTIATKQGKVEGFLSGGAVVFRGIPYAAPPVGELRFRRPQEHEPWDGVLGCKEFGCSCPQADLSGLDLYGKEFYDVPMPAVASCPAPPARRSSTARTWPGGALYL